MNMDFDGLFYDKNDYEFNMQKKIGSGSFGEVYHIKKKNDEKLKLCVKILKTDREFESRNQKMFIRESLILYNVNHPAIVRFYGINLMSLTEIGKFEPSIITEFLPNGSLDYLLYKNKDMKKNILTPTRKYIILLGISNAMQYLHHHNIIHRDIKPENIIFDENYEPHICDFGLSRSFSLENLMMSKLVGTPLYMAPELIKKSESYDSKVDVYAFAILLNELLDEKAPYYNHPQIASSIFGYVLNDGRPNFAKNATEKMKKLLNDCWNKDAEKRWTFDKIYRELAGDLSYFSENLDKKCINEYIEKLQREEEKRNESEYNYETRKSESSLNTSKNDESKSDTKTAKEQEPNSENKEILNTEENPTNNTEKCNNNNNDDDDDDDDDEDHLICSNKSDTCGEELLFSALDAFFGNEKGRNLYEAVSNLRFSSSKGNSTASYILGLLYESGTEVDRDFSKSSRFYKLAASQGNSNGFARLGLCFMNGYGTKEDLFTAYDYISMAAEKGNARALVILGQFFEKGEIVAQNNEEAIENYRKAELLGSSSAICNIAHCYANGLGFDQNLTKAIELYEKAGSLGCSNAYYNIALIYTNGRPGIEKDYKKAMLYANKAANLGNSFAFFLMGIFYEEALGVIEDKEKAFNFYKKSAELANPDASYKVGLCYKNGYFVAKDLNEASKYYQKAFDLGFNKNKKKKSK